MADTTTHIEDCIPKKFKEIKQYHEIRGNMVEALINRLVQLLDEPCARVYIKRLALSIELECFNYAIHTATEKNIQKSWDNLQFANVYSIKSMSVIRIITSATLLIATIDSPTFVKDIINMSPEQVAPEIYNPLIRDINKQLAQKIKAKISTMYVCRQCHKKTTEFHHIQLRSLDESADLSIKCVNCGFQWFA